MAPLLGMAAGAGEGLDTYLERLLKEHDQTLQGQQLQETSRHNQAGEEYQLKALADNIAGRRDVASMASADRRATADDREGVQLGKGLDELVDGTRVSPATQRRAIDLRAVPPERFGAEMPPSMGRSDPNAPGNGEVGPEIQGSPIVGSASSKLAMLRVGDSQKDNERQDKSLQETITHDRNMENKPPAPDRVLVQTDSGYRTRDDVRADLRGGKDVALPTTASTRTMEEGAKMLRPHIAKLETLAQDLDAKGLFGPVMSRVRQAMAKAGTIDEFNAIISSDPTIQSDRAVGRFATSLGLLASGAGRVHGGARGGGSPAMYANFKALLSDASSLNMFLGRLDAVDEYMSGYAAGPGGEVAAPASGEGMQSLLDRLKARQAAQ